MDYFYRVEESVGKYYITHPGMYDTKEAAEKEAKKYPNARAALYKTGIKESERVETNH